MHKDMIPQYLEEIVHTMNDGLLVVGPDGRITMVNDALLRLTGFRREELLDRPCTVLNCDVCKISRKEGKKHWCRLFDTKAENRKRCTIQRKDGTLVPVLKNASLLTEGDRVLAGVETLTDITELDERERRIEDLSRLLEDGFHGLVGRSPAMERLYGILEKAAASDAPVIIYGESGTGKELAANAIHELGPRREKPFIQFNCAALNESLLESELFGHVKGAFTGAISHRQGRFEAAHGGDIFLDEIGDVPPATQVKLLRVLETGLVERVGENRSIEVNVRVITATNRNLEAMVAQGTFRSDLFFRINVIPIHLPPLRERREDIPLLVETFLSRIREKTGKPISGLSAEAMRRFMAHPWPGNVRELKSALEYACVIADHGHLEPEHLPLQFAGKAAVCPPEARAQAAPAPPARGPREELLEALRLAGGNKSEAARLLGVNRGTILNRMRKFGVDVKTVVGG